MEENKVIDIEATEINEQEVNEQEKETVEFKLTSEDINNIMESLRDHKEHIEDLYKEIDKKRSLIDLSGVDVAGVAKWTAFAVIGIALSKNGGAFGLDIPFFHVRIGNDK